VSWHAPEKVLITGGHETGGVASFAEGLESGFAELGIASEVIRPSQVLSRWRELHDQRVLKILSTTAVLAVPFTKRAICIAHGLPYLPEQGWAKAAGFIASYKLANAVRSARLVSVSYYSAVHLYAFFGVRVDAVIHNPVKPLYLEPFQASDDERTYVTYVGRLVPAKNLNRVLPAIRDLLDDHARFRALIIGDGPELGTLSAMMGDDPRVEFKTNLSDLEVRDYLRHSKIFVSGHPTEGFGITYVEALSQGCVVAMPASGGGIEIALPRLGDAVHLFPISLGRAEVVEVLRRAVNAKPLFPVPVDNYSAKAVALDYLDVDRGFSAATETVTQTVRT
jgi:glycosyltransferase involved in cell wall biosynthesis